MKKITPPFITYTVSVLVTAKLDEDFYQEDAEARGTQKDIETSLRRHLDAWEKERHCPLYKPSVDVELTDYEIELPEERDEAYERAAAKARGNDFEATGGKDWT
jgi:hypothetical protein